MQNGHGMSQNGQLSSQSSTLSKIEPCLYLHQHLAPIFLWLIQLQIYSIQCKKLTFFPCEVILPVNISFWLLKLKKKKANTCEDQRNSLWSSTRRPKPSKTRSSYTSFRKFQLVGMKIIDHFGGWVWPTFFHYCLQIIMLTRYQCNKNEGNLVEIPRLKRDTCVREVVKTTALEQDPRNNKIDGGLCLHLLSSTSKDGVFIAYPPLYPAVKNDSEIQTSLFLFI